MSDKPYAFVGDLHGRVSILDRILSRDRELRYHYVFIGDILHHKHFFKYCKKSSPVAMLSRVYNLVHNNNATLILGNNENYILRSLILPIEQVKKKEVRYTLHCLKELELSERLKYISLLSNSPLYLELEEGYRLAHAYYPHSTQEISRDTVLHGPGYLWFRDDNLREKHGISPQYKYFFGHWGYPYRRENISIIDATSLEAAGVYYSDRDEFMVYY